MEERIFYSKGTADLQKDWYDWFCKQTSREDHQGWKDKVEAIWQAFIKDKIALQEAYSKVDAARAALEESRTGDQELTGTPAPPGMAFCNNCWKPLNLKKIVEDLSQHGCYWGKCGCRVYLNVHTTFKHGVSNTCHDSCRLCERHHWRKEIEDSIAKDGDTRWMVESTSGNGCHFSTEKLARGFVKTVATDKNKYTVRKITVHII